MAEQNFMPDPKGFLPDPMSTPIGDGTSSAAGSNTAPFLPYHDLRQWLEEAKKLGEVREIGGLTYQQDIGMVAEMSAHADDAPCFVFEDVPGTLKGSRLLVNFFAGKRKNMTLGFSTELSKLELSESFRVNHAGMLKRIPPKFVESGPVMQNVMQGETIDVTKFPAPQWHPQDGGRYIGTGCYNIMRDPDDGWINCGTYRVMIHDQKSLGFYISPGKHGRVMRDKYAARGERMPVVIVCGGDPMSFLMGSSEVPPGVCELDIIGGMRGQPVEVIKGPVTGLPIPANAEIAIEGFVEPGNVRLEGPFGEWTGYYASDHRPEPVIDIKAIYHRHEPILLGCVPQRPPDEICRYRAIVRSALLRENIEKAGVPGVTAAWAHEVGNARLFLAVARQAALSRPRQAGRPHRRAVPRRRLLRALCDRGRRRHRRLESGRSDLGADHALGSRHLDRHHSRRLVDAARSAHRARAQSGWRLHQQPRRNRRLPAVALARPIPGGQHAVGRRTAHRIAKIRTADEGLKRIARRPRRSLIWINLDESGR